MKINLIKTDRVLSQTSIKLADYVINPYRGCAFGCLYCYSRNNKNMQARKSQWGEFVDVKINCMEVLQKEIDQKVINQPGQNNTIRILLGSVTEVFQTKEKEYHLAERILDLLREKQIPLTILTKSSLIAGYLDMLDYSDENMIYFTYNTKNIKSLFEKNTPNNKKRLEIMKLILEKNIKLTCYISPFMPYLSDHRTIMDDLSTLPEKRFRIYFEGYNMRMGNWDEVKREIPEKLLKRYNDLYSNKKNYNEYWENLKQDISDYNKRYNYRIKFLNSPYDDFFKNRL
jgi:DNA repair photolyase